VKYLREDLNWPLDADDVDDVAFDYDPEELGIDAEHAVRIRKIKQIRPLAAGQPWGVFYVDFEPKRLPVVVLRRILRALTFTKRAEAQKPDQAAWRKNDILFISAQGKDDEREISFAHFAERDDGFTELQTFSWDMAETHFYYIRMDLDRLRWPDDANDIDNWRREWAKAFTVGHHEVIATSKELSIELADSARKIRERVLENYKYESRNGQLHNLYASFKRVLIHDLDVAAFADMVAQTISYGLFFARCTGQPVLGLASLGGMLPSTNPFLQELFGEFTKAVGRKHQIDFDDLEVAGLIYVLRNVDIESILRDFGRQTGGGTEDPVLNFYELFLKEYDPTRRVERGVFYTPKPVVSFIVRAVDVLLRSELDCPDGLADTSTTEWKGRSWPKVMILDPATGTGTFLETAIQVIYETMSSKWRTERYSENQIRDAWNEYVPKHLLPRLYGFELMMAPYVVAHVKIGLKLLQTGYDFKSSERLHVYLTNTLERPTGVGQLKLIPEFLAHEAEEAGAIKRETPITVVVGNPPYLANSANSSWESREKRKLSFIGELLRDYYRVDGSRFMSATLDGSKTIM
jgi:hypothetical protein